MSSYRVENSLVTGAGVPVGDARHSTKTFHHMIAVLLLVGSTGCSEASEPHAATTTATVTELVGCQPHIEVNDAAWWARELEKPESWVQANYRINLFSGFGSNRGTKVGEMSVGSRALILEENSDAYRVRSPLDKSTGWISKIQVARTLRQDVQTRKSC